MEGTRGHVPPHLVRICPLVPPQTVWYSDLFDLFQTTLCSWNMYIDSSVIPEHGEWHSKNTWARYSSGIESKYTFVPLLLCWSVSYNNNNNNNNKNKFEYKYGLRSNFRAPNLKIFMPPDFPSVSVLMHAPSSRCPPNLKYLPPPLLKIGWVLIMKYTSCDQTCLIVCVSVLKL